MTKQVITDDFVITSEIARAINHWLHSIGDDTSKYAIRLDLEHDIREVVVKALDEGRKKCEKYKDRLNGNVPKWTAKVHFDAGYRQQCMLLEPFEAETKEEAQKIADEKVTAFFEENPNAEVYEVKVKKFVDEA
jgi:hypothetical protein